MLLLPCSIVGLSSCILQSPTCQQWMQNHFFSAFSFSFCTPLVCLQHLSAMQTILSASSSLCIWTRFSIKVSGEFFSDLYCPALQGFLTFNLSEFVIFYFSCLGVMSTQYHLTLCGLLYLNSNPTHHFGPLGGDQEKKKGGREGGKEGGREGGCF